MAEDRIFNILDTKDDDNEAHGFYLNDDGTAGMFVKVESGVDNMKGVPHVLSVPQQPDAANGRLLIAENVSENRIVALLFNYGSQTVFLKPSSDVSVNNIPLMGNSVFIDENTNSAWYGITAIGTADIRVLEITKL